MKTIETKKVFLFYFFKLLLKILKFYVILLFYFYESGYKNFEYFTLGIYCRCDIQRPFIRCYFS